MGKKSKRNNPSSSPKHVPRKSVKEVPSNPVMDVTAAAAATITNTTLRRSTEEESNGTRINDTVSSSSSSSSSSSANGIVSTVTNEHDRIRHKLQQTRNERNNAGSSTQSTTNHDATTTATVPPKPPDPTEETTSPLPVESTEETPPLFHHTNDNNDDNDVNNNDSGGTHGTTTVLEHNETVMAVGSNERNRMTLLLPHEERSKQYEATLRQYLRPVYNYLCTTTTTSEDAETVPTTPTLSNTRVGHGPEQLGFLSLVTLDRAWNHVQKQTSHQKNNTMDDPLVQCVIMDANMGALLEGLGGLVLPPQTVVSTENEPPLLFGVTFPAFVQCYRIVFLYSQQALDHLGQHHQPLDPKATTTVASAKDRLLTHNHVVQQRIQNRTRSLLQTFVPPSTSFKPNVTPPPQPRGETNATITTADENAGPMKVKPSNSLLWLATYVLLLGFAATALQLMFLVTDPMLLKHPSTSVSVVTSSVSSMPTSKSPNFVWWTGTEEQRIARAIKRVHELEQSYKIRMLHLERLGDQNDQGMERLDHLELALSKTGFLIHARETQMSRIQATIQQMEQQLAHAAKGGATMHQLMRQCQRTLQKMAPPSFHPPPGGSGSAVVVAMDVNAADQNHALERLVHRRQLMGAIVGATFSLSLPWAIKAGTTFISTATTTMTSTSTAAATTTTNVAAAGAGAVTAIPPTLPALVASSPTIKSSPAKAFLKWVAVAWSGNNGEMVSQARHAGTVTAQILKP